MNDLHYTEPQLITPFEMGYRMPAEWRKHDAVWLAWPYDRTTFPGRVEKVEKTYVEIISALHKGEKVNLLVLDKSMEQRAAKYLKENKTDMPQVVFHIYDYADVWFRDYGPLFIVNDKKNDLAMVQWKFNAWGGKYEELLKDAYVPLMINEKLNIPFYSPDIFLEGGSIDVNGEGILITTKQCLLNDNRNKELSAEEIESFLKGFTGAEEVIWLEGGIAGDDTDGHIDDVARFVNSDTVLAAWEKDTNDINYEVLQKNFEILTNFTSRDGNKLKVVKLPMPSGVENKGQSLPASYANFYIGNSAVLVPVFNRHSDETALSIISDFSPGRRIVGIDCTNLVFGFGAIHCITQQQPSLMKK